MAQDDRHQGLDTGHRSGIQSLLLLGDDQLSEFRPGDLVNGLVMQGLQVPPENAFITSERGILQMRLLIAV